MQKPPKLEVISWCATIVATLIAIASYFSFGFFSDKETTGFTYKEIVACSALAQILNSRASEDSLFKADVEEMHRLNEKMEEITDSVIVNAEGLVNKMSLGDFRSYKADVHRYAVESLKSVYSGSTDYYKMSLYLSTKCGSLNSSGLTLKDP